MSFMNFRPAILCGVFCLCACSMSVNAQEILIDFGSPVTEGTTGNLLAPFANNSALFTTTLNDDGISNSNVLTEPIIVDVPEAGAAGLELTVNATVTSGIDSAYDNGAQLRVTGIGLGLRAQQNLRDDPNLNANDFQGANSVPANLFRLDATHDEFLMLSFNQDVTVSAIVINDIGPGETFQFGSATNITDLSDLTLPDLTLGTFVSAGDGFGDLQTFTFETPVEIAAGEEIVVGQTGFDPATNTFSNSGVGFEQIILTIDDGGLDDGHGDVNLDGIVNFLDIAPFISILSTGGSPAEESQADCSGDGVVSFLDISPFIQALAAAAS